MKLAIHAILRRRALGLFRHALALLVQVARRAMRTWLTSDALLPNAQLATRPCLRDGLVLALGASWTDHGCCLTPKTGVVGGFSVSALEKQEWTN